MSVVYETGTASSPTDLKDKLVTFLEANGWTTGVPTTAEAVVIWPGSDAIAYCAFYPPDDDKWRTRGCLGFDDEVGYSEQPGGMDFFHDCNFGSGPFTAYHFYVGDEAGARYVHVAVEVTASIYRHWSFGELVKSGPYTGGAYTDSTFHDPGAPAIDAPEHQNHRFVCDAASVVSGAGVYVDLDGKTDNWQSLARSTDFSTDGMIGSIRDDGRLAFLLTTIGRQSYNLRTPLWPLHYFANRASSLRSPLGRIPGMRAVDMLHFQPGELLTSGGDIWQLFPVAQRRIGSVSDDTVSSGLYGYAYLRPSA